MRTLSAMTIVRGVCIVIIAGCVIAWGYGAIDPTVHVPTPVMPTPNAFDDFNAATAMYHDVGIVDNSFNSQADAARYGLSIPSQEEQDSAAERGKGVVRRLEVGLTHAYLAPPIRKSGDTMPYYAKDRGLARLLAFEGKRAEKSGNWTQAANDGIDAIALGGKISHGAALIGDLVGMACSAIGRKGCWDIAANVDSATAKADARRIEAALESKATVSQALQEEEWFGQSEIADMMRSPVFFVAATSGTIGARGVNTSGFLEDQLMQTRYPKRTIFANYTRYMNQAVKLYGLPYIYSARAVQPAVPNDPVNKAIDLTGLTRIAFKDASDRAFTSLLMTSLALRAYRLDHGSYPNSLNGLAPIYLKTVPIDPLSDNQPLKYRLTGDSYVLYSIGPDGIDDGGKPFVNNEQPSRPIRTFCEPDTKGDIVAGANPG